MVGVRGSGSDEVVQDSGRSGGRDHRGAALLDPDDRLQEQGEDALAVGAGEGQGDLGLDHAELDPEVEPRPPRLQRQVSLATGQGVQGRGELDRAQLADVAADQVVEQLEDRGRQHVHAEEAEVMPRAEAGHLEPQLGQGRVRLLDDLVDDVDLGMLGQPAAGERPVLVDQVLAGGLHGGDGAPLGRGQLDQLAGASPRSRRRRRRDRSGAGGHGSSPTNDRAHQTAWP